MFHIIIPLYCNKRNISFDPREYGHLRSQPWKIKPLKRPKKMASERSKTTNSSCPVVNTHTHYAEK